MKTESQLNILRAIAAGEQLICHWPTPSTINWYLVRDGMRRPVSTSDVEQLKTKTRCIGQLSSGRENMVLNYGLAINGYRAIGLAPPLPAKKTLVAQVEELKGALAVVMFCPHKCLCQNCLDAIKAVHDGTAKPSPAQPEASP